MSKPPTAEPDVTCEGHGAASEAVSFNTGRPVRVSSWHTLRTTICSSFSFLLQTEVHVYSFAVAANILMSFFPFLAAMISLCHSVLHWKAASDILLQTLKDYFPENFGVNFRGYLLSAMSQKFSWISMFLLLFTANGIFVPLEVALNRIWRVKHGRSFLQNQIVSLGLIFGCGMLVLANICFTTINAEFLRARFGSTYWNSQIQSFTLRVIALPLTALVLFLVYWLLPNTKIPVSRVLPVSLVVAILLEVAKYVNVLTWPWLRSKLIVETPPFVQSISIILWSFLATLIVLGGAEWSARVQVDKLEE